jgi:OmpA-OmpF porin, OOP family
MKNKFYSFMLAGFGAWMIASCTSTPPTEVSSIPADSDPNREISAFEAELKQAKDQGAQALSPNWYNKAEANLEQAKALRAKQGKYTDIFASIEKGRENLKQTEKFTQISKTVMDNVIKEREQSLAALDRAEKAGAKNVRPAYRDAEESFLRLSKAVENDDIKWAENHKTEVIQKYREAAGVANKKRTLGVAEQLIENCKQIDGRKFAPQALKLAEQNYDTSDKFATNNPQATEEMEKHGETAQFYARRCVNLAQESRSLDDRHPEERALYVEGKLNTIGRTAEVGDLRDKNFDTQVTQIDKAVLALKNEAKGEGSRTAALESEKERLTAELGSSKEEAARRQHLLQLDRKFAAVRKMFNPSEAEVLRDGDKLIIRLRSVKFPVGKAQIRSENFALMNKVNRALNEFNNINVVVEGHTDSTGSAETNEKLSLDRANAVKEYLVANEAIEAGNIDAVGMSFNKPLASNKTADGRAQNRRIDVVIQPQSAVASEESESDTTSAE